MLCRYCDSGAGSPPAAFWNLLQRRFCLAALSAHREQRSRDDMDCGCRWAGNWRGRGGGRQQARHLTQGKPNTMMWKGFLDLPWRSQLDLAGFVASPDI